jgi:hypothetical protein
MDVVFQEIAAPSAQGPQPEYFAHRFLIRQVSIPQPMPVGHIPECAAV